LDLDILKTKKPIAVSSFFTLCSNILPLIYAGVLYFLISLVIKQKEKGLNKKLSSMSYGKAGKTKKEKRETERQS